MRFQLYHRAVYIIVFIFLFGCSRHYTKTTNVTRDVSIRPQHKHHYVIYYIDESSIHIFNSKTNTDNLIFHYPSNSSVRGYEISPDKTKVALTYIDNNTEETSLTVLDLISFNSWNIKRIPKNFYFSFKWSPESKELAVGYYTIKDPMGHIDKGKGDIFIVSYDGTRIKSIGCKVSKIITRWLPNGVLIVGNRIHYYGVKRQSCATIFSFVIANKTMVTFSPDGTKVFYYKYIPVYKESGARQNMPELYLANCDGKNQRKIIGYKYYPRNASWSPNGQKIVCEIRSLEWIDVKHIAIYGLATGKASFTKEENELGTPKSEKPYWSPDGNNILYDQTYKMLYDRRTYETFYNRIYEPGLESFSVKHKILENLITNKKEIIREGSFHLNQFLNQPVGITSRWIDNQNVLLYTAKWFKIINVLDKSIYTFSPKRRPMYIKQL